MKNSIGVLLMSLMLAVGSNAQVNLPWFGKQCAVVLTYDDALNVHLDNAIPLLDSLGLKGTFYLTGSSPVLKNRMDEWRKAASNGHELGNHTLFHPCNGQLPGREWVNKDHDLSNYSLGQIMDEINMENVLLQAVDGKKARTFAYTCGDMNAGNVSFKDEVAKVFVGARGVSSGMHKINDIDLSNIDSYVINGDSGDKLVELVKKAMETNSLIVFLFHGVGGEHNLNVSLPAHSQLLYFLKENENKIWITTLVDAASHIKEFNSK
jgi:peptidoglycan/xylan/chitin deacetylase (PgdA/CDA1 family)